MSSAPLPELLLVDRLRAAGCVFAEDEADLLVASATSYPHLQAMVDQRLAGLPLEQVVGWVELCGRRIALAPGVFVPRRRTELLVHEAVALVRPGSVVVDLCCGSGAVGACLPDVELHAADIAAEAVACARANLPSATVYLGDLFDPLPSHLRGRVEVLIANAPYVPSASVGLLPPEARLHEPLEALDGGPDGLDVVRRVVASAADWLAPHGRLLIETSAAQAPQVATLMEAAGLLARIVTSDLLDATVTMGAMDA